MAGVTILGVARFCCLVTVTRRLRGGDYHRNASYADPRALPGESQNGEIRVVAGGKRLSLFVLVEAFSGTWLEVP